jgi:ketosteroid isomerase-like protein
MKTLSTIFSLIILFAGCNSNKLSETQVNSEKDKIRARIESFLLSYEKKDMNTILGMLSNSKDFFFLGSDIVEINRSKADFQNQLDKDWKLFESISFGDIRKLTINISNYGDLATAIYEVPVTAMLKGNQSKFFFRMTNVFEFENGLWQIVQGVVSIPSVGESSAELNQRPN